MGIISQMKDILRLLDAAQDDLQAWVCLAEDEDSNFNLSDDAIEETRSLIGEIQTLLHEART
ncbi:hypothetical protein IAQ67_15755 [Paenibacillus peoriae]|uniref:Uncharacterized protein n=1 Tax=Paenibacillus peoriae TaxID=59893 RepID=A0A7H0Y2P2_9BACL|nr:hypothetical protein [Paenibacillus peoriae]QNR65350.1 hypothetical protein IAQ67_15755 [Paenibacillus peoriae]